MDYLDILKKDLLHWQPYITHSNNVKLISLFQIIEQQSLDIPILPSLKDIFKAFRITKPFKIKVVILGQEPYYNGNATGLAFACKRKISPMLYTIMKTMHPDATIEALRHNKDLHCIANQGVFLLNTVLTVLEGKTNAHKSIGWKTFIKDILINFSVQEKGVVYLLWGSHAKQYRRFINETDNLVLEAKHPIYANRKSKTWDCNHFNLVNEYLLSIKKKPINWSFSERN